ERAALAQKPREQHDLGPERRASRLPRERRAQRGLGALDFALVAQDFAEVGGGERIVRLQRERAGERALRLCELAEGALRIAEIVPGARVIGLDYERLLQGSVYHHDDDGIYAMSV